MSLELEHQDPTTLAAGGAQLRCALVPWDRETFGFEVAAVLALTGDARDYPELLEAYQGWCEARQVRFSSARLPLEQRAAASALQAGGFEWQELVVHPVFEVAGEPAPADPDLGHAREDERAAIEAIAATAFVHQRFHVDPRCPAELANARYADWVRRSWEDPSDRFLVLRQDGHVAGFWIYELRERSAYLHLTAVAAAYRGQRLGQRLWASGAGFLARQGALGIRTTVSAANLPVVALYGRLGWRLRDPEITLHRWHD